MSTAKKSNPNDLSKVVAFGNRDKEQKYPITQDVIDRGRYVLLHYKNHTYPDPNNPTKLIDSGDVDTSTKRVNTYTKSTYDEYTRENEREGKVNYFNKMLGKYIILHDPTLEPEKKPAGSGNELSGKTNAQLKEILAGLPLSEEDKAAIKGANKEALLTLVSKYSTPTE